jgi:hypothetical protein
MGQFPRAGRLFAGAGWGGLGSVVGRKATRRLPTALTADCWTSKVHQGTLSKWVSAIVGMPCGQSWAVHTPPRL